MLIVLILLSLILWAIAWYNIEYGKDIIGIISSELALILSALVYIIIVLNLKK